MWEFSYPSRLGDTGLGRNFRFVMDEHGRSYGQQVNDFKVISKGPGKLLFPDYYRYGLHRYFNKDDVDSALEYVSKRQQLALINAESTYKEWNKQHYNKTTIKQRLHQEGIRHPATKLVYDQDVSRRELKVWLGDAGNYPFFGKPANGNRSGGVCLAVGYEKNVVGRSSDSDLIYMVNGESISVGDFISGVDQHKHGLLKRNRAGYMFQDVVSNCSQIASEVGGHGASTFRMVSYGNRDAHVLKHCIWKIPVGNEIADNFWRGSILAGIDINSGKVISAVRGTGIQQERVKNNEKGTPLVGFEVPEWGKLREFVSNASKMFSDVEVQSWDICLTEEGPSVVEFNPGGDISLVQHAYDRGVLTNEYLRELKEMAERKKTLDAY